MNEVRLENVGLVMEYSTSEESAKNAKCVICGGEVCTGAASHPGFRTFLQRASDYSSLLEVANEAKLNALFQPAEPRTPLPSLFISGCPDHISDVRFIQKAFQQAGRISPEIIHQALAGPNPSK